jgi:hypothetical protein
MKRQESAGEGLCTRRDLLSGAAGAISASFVSTTLPETAWAEPQGAGEAELKFRADGKAYRFDTGALRGALRSEGRSRGLIPVVDCASGTAIARGAGLFSHYRLLDAESRYGHAGWDWASRSRLLADGSVEVRWTADEEHPFDMTARYRWAASNALDVTTSVVPREDLECFEVFLASYFHGFPTSLVYVGSSPETGGQPGFLKAKKTAGVWQMFPRDEKAARLIGDGRWQRPPNPVQWTIMPRLARPLAMRRDEATGLSGLVMAPAEDCFAVATPYGEEGHRSLYLCLFGHDVQAGRNATVRSRLVIDRGISHERAVALYEAYLKEV